MSCPLGPPFSGTHQSVVQTVTANDQSERPRSRHCLSLHAPITAATGHSALEMARVAEALNCTSYLHQNGNVNNNKKLCPSIFHHTQLCFNRTSGDFVKTLLLKRVDVSVTEAVDFKDLEQEKM